MFTPYHLMQSITITAASSGTGSGGTINGGTSNIAQDLMVSASAPPQGSPALLTEAELAPIVTDAEKRLEADLGPQTAAALAGVTVEVANLPAGLLGQTTGTTIRIDQDAAGYGWFVDPTPDDE